MKTLKKNWAKLAGTITLAGLAFCAVYACVSAWGQTAPALAISPLGSNNFSITITNGDTNAFYYLWWTPSLNDPAYPWTVLVPGNPAQTNFSVNAGMWSLGFFRASIGNSTGVPPWEAADPSDPNSAILTVVINSPTNGAVVQ